MAKKYQMEPSFMNKVVSDFEKVGYRICVSNCLWRHPNDYPMIVTSIHDLGGGTIEVMMLFQSACRKLGFAKDLVSPVYDDDGERCGHIIHNESEVLTILKKSFKELKLKIKKVRIDGGQVIFELPYDVIPPQFSK